MYFLIAFLVLLSSSLFAYTKYVGLVLAFSDPSWVITNPDVAQLFGQTKTDLQQYLYETNLFVRQCIKAISHYSEWNGIPFFDDSFFPGKALENEMQTVEVKSLPLEQAVEKARLDKKELGTSNKAKHEILFCVFVVTWLVFKVLGIGF